MALDAKPTASRRSWSRSKGEGGKDHLQSFGHFILYWAGLAVAGGPTTGKSASIFVFDTKNGAWDCLYKTYPRESRRCSWGRRVDVDFWMAHTAGA